MERAQQEKENIRKGFFAKSGTDRMVNVSDVLRNPFVFKGQVVNVWVQFSRMTAENEAEFNDPHPGVNSPAMIARNVPSSRFTSPVNTVVAIRVIGLKDRSIDAEFVDAYTCRSAPCQEFVQPGE